MRKKASRKRFFLITMVYSQIAFLEKKSEMKTSLIKIDQNLFLVKVLHKLNYFFT